jgi:tetratricopeptide (TPR) repeat protein
MVTNLDKKQIDLIKESLCVYEKARECKSLLRQEQLFFANIEDFVDDRGKSCLFRLKEMCHDLFRNSSEASYKEKLFDMTVGYTFHGAMKLRENLYLLEYYKPQCEIALEDLTDQEKKIVNEISTLVRKARGRLKEELKEVTVLADELATQLKDLILLYKGNYLLPRFLYEYEKTLTKIYGRKGFEDILVTAYADGKMLLLFKTANSYLESEYFDTARKLFKRIIRSDSSNTAALFLYIFASANHFYFKNMFTRALALAKKAESMNPDAGIREKYRPLLTRLIADLSKEIKKKTDERR